MSLYSPEAEQSVIGACLLDNKLIDRAADILTHQDFASLENAVIWSAMNRLRNAGQACDVVTVSERLEQDNASDDVGGLVYLAEIARQTPSASNGLAYAEVVADLAGRRRLIGELGNVDAMARDKVTPLTSIVDDAQGRLSRLVRADADQASPMSNDLREMIDELDRKWNGESDAMGLSFGLSDLDRRTMGMHPGQLILVGGRPSMGKTAFALNILRACCIRDRRPGLVFSMEMDRRALRNRMTAAAGDMPLNAIRDPRNHMTDEHWPKLTSAVNAMKEAPLIVDDRAGMTPSQIRGAAKRWRDHYGELGVVMVDYLQLARPDARHGSREQEVSELSRSMKLLAKELGCPVVALSQLNRSLEQRSDKRPMMADLRESGSLEQDADLILFLYRDEVYHPDNELSHGVAEIIIGKQREGDIGTVYAFAQLAHARFGDLDHQAISQLAEASKPQPKPARRSAMAEI
ncbi:replicative DNA helicase [Halomonas sp. I1]|uniref:replicative DNA helicase n=1 Tax=Halomonas sp. I1 TaxID=393536 RepID=UPI0028DEAB35|nr:replicative DNA helicase [Halomonas sp. I1]MDT8895660.1 replicative DNA helicase [Halomonas sp. I1]